MADRERARDFWDDVVNEFLDGGFPLRKPLNVWIDAYVGTGVGAVDRNAMPEAYCCPLLGDARSVFLGLNQAVAIPAYQYREAHADLRVVSVALTERARCAAAFPRHHRVDGLRSYRRNGSSTRLRVRAPWIALLDRLGARRALTLGKGGEPYGSTVPSRTVAVYELDGYYLVAEKHAGSAGPPSAAETLVLKNALLQRGFV
jgi:hypothetical protein